MIFVYFSRSLVDAGKTQTWLPWQRLSLKKKKERKQESFDKRKPEPETSKFPLFQCYLKLNTTSVIPSKQRGRGKLQKSFLLKPTFIGSGFFLVCLWRNTTRASWKVRRGRKRWQASNRRLKQQWTKRCSHSFPSSTAEHLGIQW